MCKKLIAHPQRSEPGQCHSSPKRKIRVQDRWACLQKAAERISVLNACVMPSWTAVIWHVEREFALVIPRRSFVDTVKLTID